jgi:hypothetical protein
MTTSYSQLPDHTKPVISSFVSSKKSEQAGEEDVHRPVPLRKFLKLMGKVNTARYGASSMPGLPLTW